MIERDAITALKRFGCGPGPGDAAAIAADPRGWVLGQCDRPQAALIEDDGLKRTKALVRQLISYRKKRRALKRDSAGDDDGRVVDFRKVIGRRPAIVHYNREAQLRIARAIETDTPFVERLVAFWSNHFCVSAAKGGKVRVIAGAYEREAIRPHVLGRFRDMLHAAVRHPAMLHYLDNTRSFGPNSPIGRKRGRGLNENLAREVLELHTLGVDGGYSQADVTNFARALTGWSVGRPLRDDDNAFRYLQRAHEPGAFRILGRVYDQEGTAQAEAVLDDLSDHPATARFVATKFARHFVGDAAPAALVDRLARSFRTSGGDLADLARTLVSSPEAWEMPAAKFLPPYDFIVALGRALGWVPNEKQLRRALRVLGQQMWTPPSPAGWPDEDDAWVSPDAILERLDLIERLLTRRDVHLDVAARADDLLGPSLSSFTRQSITRAESRRQAFALLLMSPEFQRR